MKTPRQLTAIITVFTVLVCSSIDLLAQNPALKDLFGQKNTATSTAPKAEISVSLLPQDAKAGDTVTLSIAMVIPKGSYTYSTNPTFGGATKFVIEESKGLTSIDKHFNADHPPKTVFEPLFGKEIEKYSKHVIWNRRFKVNPDVKDISKVLLKGQMIYQVCDSKSCIPANYNFTAKLSGKHESSPLSQTVIPERRLGPDPVKLSFDLAPSKTGSEKLVQLTITMTLERDFHTFALDHDKSQVGLPTHIEIFKLEGLKPVSKQFSVTPEPTVETHDDKTQRTHYEKVVWSRVFERIPGDEEYGVEGKLTYQLCNEVSCRRPLPVEFQLGNLTNAKPVVISSIEELKGGSDEETFASASDASKRSLALNLFFAFLGGLILNVMPCVLPVVAIKVMSFVQQAGESKIRIFLLNIFYSLGVVAVFVALASLAVFAGLGWGELFQSTKFNIAMACIVYAMGLSMLGVFEIPVPGLIGSAAGGQQKEGLIGAFLTGILATLLATPCSGPFLGPVLAWSVSQTPDITYLVWIVMGVGMASPYLVFSVFPKAISHLPKPGMWMVRFKEFSGIVLMGAVIFIISSMDESLTIPVLIMLLGITTGLWMIGSLYEHNSSIQKKMVVRASALLLTTGICLFGYETSQKSAYELPWIPFNTAELERLRAENKIVLIDFSADWCLSCKTNEKYALNTEETLELIKKHNIVTMYADYTDYSPEIKKKLAEFNSISIPLTVIYPANQLEEAITIPDLYSQSTLLERLQEAIDASPPAEKPTKQAMVSTAAPK